MLKKLVATVKRVKRLTKRKASISKDVDTEPSAAQQVKPLVHKFTLDVDEALNAGLGKDEVEALFTNGDVTDAAHESPRTPGKHHDKSNLPFAADSVCGGRFSNEDAYCVVPNFILFPLHSMVCPPSCPFLQQQQQQQQQAAPAAAAPIAAATAVPPSPHSPRSLAHHGQAPGHGISPSPESAAKELLHFFGVYDGHGGGAAAEHCAGKLHRHLREDVLPCILKGRSSGSAAPPVDRACAAPHVGAGCSAVGSEPAGHMHDTAEVGVGGAGCAIESAFASAFIKTHKEFVAASQSTYVGTTAVVTLVGDSNIWVANCGDSRAVLCRQGQAIALSSDHKPTRDDEAARVKAAGGHVLWDRVMGELAVSRAIGDEFLRPYVIADPEVVHMPRTPDDELLLLATDGLWDVFTNQEACDVALKQLHKGWAEGGGQCHCRQAARHLIREALMRSTRDNVTVVVVDLKMLKAAIAGGLPGVGGCAEQCVR